VRKDSSTGEVVQQCTTSEGFQMRWVFDEIESDSFHWSSSTSRDEGKTWELQGELFARRRG